MQTSNGSTDVVRDLITNSLRRARDAYERALATSDNTFSFLGIEMYVDQVRGIVFPASHAVERSGHQDGKATITHPLLIGLFTGAGKFLSVDRFMEILREVIDGSQVSWVSHLEVALFVNLMVVESRRRPALGTTIFLVVAQELAQGRDDANIFELLDLQRAPPQSGAVVDDVSDDDVAAILGILPDLRPRLDRLVAENGRADALALVAGELREFIHTNVFVKLTEYLP